MNKGCFGNLSNYQKLKAKRAVCKHKYTDANGTKHDQCIKCGQHSKTYLKSLRSK